MIFLIPEMASRDLSTYPWSWRKVDFLMDTQYVVKLGLSHYH